MTIDLAGCETKEAVHEIFKQKLGFPEFYGANWDVFWDSIARLVEMPDEVRLVNWQGFAQACPRDIQILREIIHDYQGEFSEKRITLE
ncbi:MAG: barstar family protein [Janthinobacterium lividum]